jgi:hypothetical protein
MIPITQSPSVFAVGLLLLFTNHAVADGVIFTCTGTKGHGVAVEGRSFGKNTVASAKGWAQIDDGNATIKLLIRNKEWDISHYSAFANKFLSYGDMGCAVQMINQEPIVSLDMFFHVSCPHASITYLFLDREKGAKLIVTDLSAPQPSMDGTLNTAYGKIYTSDCRQGE